MNATIKQHLTKSVNIQVRQIANDIYVHNIIAGTQTEHKALELYKSTKTTIQEISMNLTCWSCSNSQIFMQQIEDASDNITVKIFI